MSEPATDDACQHPECGDDSTEVYRDPNGNEITLCNRHYFEAVYPPWPEVRVSEVADRRDDYGLWERLFK